ncbi:MAG: cellulose-binding protein, partial [Bacteroidota bacterium]
MHLRKKILPLGDSITQGYPWSYRYELWKALIRAEFPFEFIGSQKDAHGYGNYWGHEWGVYH